MRTSIALLASLAASINASPTPNKRAQRIEASDFGPAQLKSAVAQTSISMEVLKARKMEHQAAKEQAGQFAMNAYSAANSTACVNGMAGEYKCNNVDMLGFLRHQDMGSRTRVGNDVWGTFIQNNIKLSD
jgi:xanthine dehydrogenase molybdopterin-binding subunit B